MQRTVTESIRPQHQQTVKIQREKNGQPFCFSNGSERSSLFCALYNLIEKLNYEGAVSVVNTVRKIKSRRAKAVPDLVKGLIIIINWAFA